MTQINIVAATNENTVITEYQPALRRSEAFQSEAELEKEFIRMLCEQGYTYPTIHTEDQLVENLRAQLELVNDYTFTDSEWERFFKEHIANPNDHMVEKCRKIQEDNVQVLKRDDGTSKNITLIHKKNIHSNVLQVINQFQMGKDQGAKHDTRYDVTILVNGFPMVHVELKRRGVQIKEAFNQINRYQRDSFWAGRGLFEYVQLYVISNGTTTKYYSNTTRLNAKNEASSPSGKKKSGSNSFDFTSYWADANNRVLPDLIDFTKTFFAKHTILNILTKYCVLTSENTLMVMRPYQITATERILNRIEVTTNYKKYGTVEGGGYIWHSTGSGKTLTSFKTARLASKLSFVDKVLFVVDRKDLDYQTMKEYDRFEKGAANGNSSTAILTKQLEDPSAKIIITTIQKLSNFVNKNKGHQVFNKHVVIIFDECHRSQFGDMHAAIIKNFKKYHIFGFTGTPIFASAVGSAPNAKFMTTDQTFGARLHTYSIVDAINDKNVLPFRVDYIKTMKEDEGLVDEDVWDIDRKKALESPERVALVTKYILDHFDQKTYRGDKSYDYKLLTNVSAVASAKKEKVEEIKCNQRIKGFNSIFAVSSVPMAKQYYQEFKNQMAADTTKALKIAVIYSYGANEAEDTNGIIDEENPEDTSMLDASSRDFLDAAILDYNKMFNTSYSTDGDSFQNYYKDVSLRMKNKELDMLIVVNMFLTGFDATTLNTLWVDKNLKMHGLVQAFSRTNRILNDIKTYGNVVCFRNLQKRVDEALAIFGDKEAGGIVLIRKFDDYYYGYTDTEGKEIVGYQTMINRLTTEFPLFGFPITTGDKVKKEFVVLFGAVLRMRNLLSSFDEFSSMEILSQRDFQDYTSWYLTIRDELRDVSPKDKKDVTDDIVFEMELIRQVVVNIDYILMLVTKYHEENCRDKELLVTIKKAIVSNPELRSKKTLIETFIENLDGVNDVMEEWQTYIDAKRNEELDGIVEEHKLNRDATRKFVENAFRDGEIKTTGTDMDAMLPATSRFAFGGGKHDEIKSRVLFVIQEFFHRFYGIGGPFKAEEDRNVTSFSYASNEDLAKVAEDVKDEYKSNI